ncbi:uncharacterized protein LOC110724108 [Chenopodium quinoa]|uniref:uncharacterized protein LOC110724108 n=1 Tax=Chenopodium quinoa TaxID=63459 RepID=UPI000B775FFE|nr:uncharacterized protein LOC110724108 [Chenopodium quinoa]
MESLVDVDTTVTKLAPLRFDGFCGVNSQGLSGGLVVFWFSPLRVVPLLVSTNVILCEICTPTTSEIKHILFVYGSPHPSGRAAVWEEISHILQVYSDILLIADFNQVEYFSDKVGGSAHIAGLNAFQEWKIENNLLDVPFSGPSYNWTNGCSSGDASFERLDKAYASQKWMIDHPNAFLLHQSILFSDHAVIVYHENSPPVSKRPYRIDNWCLQSKDVFRIITVIWAMMLPGSPMLEKRKNLIHGLKDSSGFWTHDQQGISIMIQNYNSQLFCSPQSQIDESKTPGPDGFSSAFFRSHWSTVGQSVIEAVQYFFYHGHMLREWNRTFITLISKVDHLEFVSQFRPIGLCNVLYKCIAKCISIRLRNILPQLVSDFQNAFVPGRLWQVDNSLVAHEILSYMDKLRGRTMGAALKVDMNKAYDRISWDFLWQVLKAFGFPPSWIHIIQQCVSTVSYQVLVNGNPTKAFRPVRGLRQGDPLSSYLFVLCMEVFSAMIRKAESDRLFRGIKSFIRFSSNVPADYRDYLAASIHVRVESSIGSYLGLLVDVGRHKCKAFQPLVDKVINRLSGLTSLHLSSVAKLVIINSMLVASFNHILSVFKIPSTVIDKINNLLLRFWWRSSSHSKGIALAPSSLLYRPKGLGGLGLRHLGIFNSAMLAKQVWRVMHNPQLLISRIFQARYPSILDRHSSSRLSRPSWAGNSLLHGFHSLQSGLTWKIGNGTKVRIFEDSWVPDSVVSPKDSLAGTVLPLLVSSLIHSNSNTWDSSQVHRLFDSFTAAKILSLERPTQLMDDFVYWKFTRDGNFSTKSAYAALIQGSFPVIYDGNYILSSWWKKFWAFPILPKWKMFVWKLLYGVIPVAALLCTKGIPVDPLCAFCHTSQETIDHLFLHCPFTRRLWSCGPLGILLPPENFSSFSHWFSTLITHSLAHGDWSTLDSILAFTWAIWCCRNSVRFWGLVPDPLCVFRIAQEWRSRSSSARDLDAGVISSPPGFHHRPLLIILRGSFSEQAVVDLLFDGAWQSADCRAGTGWCFYQAGSLQCLGGGAQACFALSAIQAELFACLLALRMAQNHGFDQIRIHTDCLGVLFSLRDHCSKDIFASWIFQQIEDIIPLFSACSIQKASRDFIRPAHELAVSARNRHSLFLSF